MYFKFGKKRLFISTKEIITLITIPTLICTAYLININYLNELYRNTAKLIPNQSSMDNIKGDSSKGLRINVKRLMRVGSQQKRQGRSMQIDNSVQMKTNLALMKSWELNESFILKYNLKPKLFPKRWDNENQRWIKPDRETSVIQIIMTSLNSTTRFFSNKKTAKIKRPLEPTTSRATKILSRKLKVRRNRKSGLITINFNSQDPKIGAEIVNNFINYTNIYISNRLQHDLLLKIEKIESLLKKEKNNAMQKILLTELETLHHSVAMNDPAVNSAFKILIPAMVPEETITRVPKIILVILFFLSFMFTLLGISRKRYKQSKTNNPKEIKKYLKR